MIYNAEIRQAIQKNHLRFYEVAHALNISEATFARWLRFELSDDKKKLVLSAVDRLLAER